MNGDTSLIIQEIKEFRKDYNDHKEHIAKELEIIKIQLASADLNQMKKDVRNLNTFKTRSVAVFTLIQTTILACIGYFYKFNK